MCWHHRAAAAVVAAAARALHDDDNYVDVWRCEAWLGFDCTIGAAPVVTAERIRLLLCPRAGESSRISSWQPNMLRNWRPTA